MCNKDPIPLTPSLSPTGRGSRMPAARSQMREPWGREGARARCRAADRSGRCMAGSMFLEIPRVDHFEAWLLDGQAEQSAARRDDGCSGFGANIAIREKANPIRAGLFH